MNIKNLKTVIISGMVITLLASFSTLAPGQAETKIRIHTTKGDILVKLYNETPLQGIISLNW